MTETTTYEPLPVAGYRGQTKSNIDLVNLMKQQEERILRRLDKLRQNDSLDQRWLAIGRTDLERAFMAINRSIFKPTRVRLPED